MFPPWRFKLREAQVALEQGRLEEAARLAVEPQLKQYLPVQQLLGQIGEQFARRALGAGRRGRSLPAAGAIWMKPAARGETADWQRLQQAVADVAVGEIVHHLEASDFPAPSRGSSRWKNAGCRASR